MHLNDKLLRKKCPSCGGEITLEARSLGRKINCPKCRQTVIIPARPPPATPSSKKARPKVKRNGHHAPPEKPPVAPEDPGITVPSDSVEESPAPAEFGLPFPKKREVTYCICNGILKKCTESDGCCVKAGRREFADEPA